VLFDIVFNLCFAELDDTKSCGDSRDEVLANSADNSRKQNITKAATSPHSC
jgi:hypothetical protein